MIRSLILALAFQFVTPVWATEGLIPNADITTELAELIKPPLEQLKEVPPMEGWPIVPMPDIDDLSKYKSGSGQELFIYGMMTAMVERADRENAECQKQLEAGYKPCYFKTIKPRDHYAKIWLEDYNALQVKNKESLERLARESISSCPSGSTFVLMLDENTAYCSFFSDKDQMENARFSCGQDVWAHTVALDSERRKKGKSGWDIYKFWEDYKIGNCEAGSIWGNGEFCHKFATYAEAGLHELHCGYHLGALKEELKKEMEAPALTPCNIVGDFSDGRNGLLWKPIGDPGKICNNARNKGGAVLFPSSFKDKMGKNLKIYDSEFKEIGGGFFKGNGNPDRPQFCTNKYGAQYGSGPIYVEYEVGTFKECRRVNNPANRED